jgi:uncharacterized protein (DUF1501 family)
MISILDYGPKLCDGFRRRELLRAGTVAMLGAGAASRSLNASTTLASSQRPKSCIVLFLMGGPPQHSTWDPKPDAPAEIRGEIAPIETNVPGITVGELMPRTAQFMDRVAVLRAMSTDDNAHSSSGYFMMTGVPHIPMNAENANPGFPNNWPTLGSVVQHLHRGQRLLPPAIRLPHHIFNTDGSVWPGQDSGWLGHRADPWLLNCTPATPGFKIPHFELSADGALGRLENRRSLLSQLEHRLKQTEASGEFDNFNSLQRQAFDLLGTAEARAACRVDAEPEDVRDRYGRGQFGQSVLMARRLVEAGVSMVQVNWFRGADEPHDAPCWDSHARETQRLKTVLIPPFDQAFSALLGELIDRGMLDDTLVAVVSEFGRTPRFNGAGGRDHWGPVFSVALAGGGIRGGQVYGRSDPAGGYPADGRVGPPDLHATMLHCLGYDPETLIHDTLGRPIPITRGQVIAPLVS